MPVYDYTGGPTQGFAGEVYKQTPGVKPGDPNWQQGPIVQGGNDPGLKGSWQSGQWVPGDAGSGPYAPPPGTNTPSPGYDQTQTNAPAPMNPTPTTPFVQQPRAAEQPQWQGPPTDNGLPQGRQPQPMQQPPQSRTRPDTTMGGVPGMNQPGPQYQGFGFGPGGNFQAQGEWGNAWSGRAGGGGQGPGAMTLGGIPGYGGTGGGGAGRGGGGVGGDGGSWGGYGQFTAPQSGDPMQANKYDWTGGDPTLNNMIGQIDWSSIPGINTATAKRNAIEQFMQTGIHPGTGEMVGDPNYWANAPGAGGGGAGSANPGYNPAGAPEGLEWTQGTQAGYNAYDPSGDKYYVGF